MPPPLASGAASTITARPVRGDTGRPDTAKVLTVFVLVVVILYFGREVLIPITLALLLTFLLAAPVNWFRRVLFGRVLSVVLVVTLARTLLDWQPAVGLEEGLQRTIGYFARLLAERGQDGAPLASAAA